MDYEIRWGVETGEAGLGEDGNEVPCIIDFSRYLSTWLAQWGVGNSGLELSSEMLAEKRTLILQEWWWWLVLPG